MSIETSHRSEGSKLLTWPQNVRIPAWLKTEAAVASLIIALFLAVGSWYSLAVPPFEAPDELFHYAFARHLAAGNPLPVQDPEVEAPWEQEGSQAPLYYWLAGRLTAGIDQSDFPQISVRNPRANIGDPLFPGNKNFMLYSAAEHPLAGSNLALHIGRWFSLILGALALLFTYLTARLAFPASPFLALMTLLIVATIPQFTFISAALTNDNLINAASAATIFWLAHLLSTEARVRNAESSATRIPHAKLHASHWVVLGILLGIAALSKLQGLGLFLLSALVGLLIAWRRRDWRLPLRLLLPVALPALAIAGWWYWRNYSLYGDWTGIGNLLANNGRRDDPLTLLSFWREFRGLRYSFWGLFGWFNLLLPQWVYTVLDGITLAALAGLVWRLAPTRSRRPVHNSPFAIRLLLFIWAILSLALLLYWTLQATGSQGRLLFPGIGALVTLLVLGLDTWLRHLPASGRRIAWLSLPALLAGSSLYALTVLLPAAYRAPAPVAAVPPTAVPIDVVYGDAETIKLLALEIPERRYWVGEAVPVTLYLQAPAPVQDDYQLFIQFLDENRVEVGNLTSHPGWGRNPTSLWQPGAIYADHYPVALNRPIDNSAPLLAQVYVGFVDPHTEKSGRFPIPARTAAGAGIEPFLGQVAISPGEPPELAGLTPVGVQFGNVIQLTGFGGENPVALVAGQPLTVTLQWDAIGTPATDYTAFVHLRDASGATVVGFDRAPAAERFPTRFWRSGDRIVSTFVLTIPSELETGDHALWVGLYESASQGALRLPVTERAGQLSGDGEVRLGLLLIR